MSVYVCVFLTHVSKYVRVPPHKCLHMCVHKHCRHLIMIKFNFLLLIFSLFQLNIASDPSDSTGGDSSAGSAGDSPAASVSGALAVANTTAAATPFPVVAPPMGEATKNLLGTWTYESIMAVPGNGESQSEDRLNLQNALTPAANEQTPNVGIMIGEVQRVNSDTMNWTQTVDKVTKLITADATAGGLSATSRSLMNELPATQKLLSKTMTTALTNLGKDGVVIQSTFNSTDMDYRERIQSSADTISSIFASQDRAFAAMTKAQAGAVNQVAGSIGSSGASSVRLLSSGAQQSISSSATAAQTASAGTALAKKGLRDAADSLFAVNAEYKSAVTDATGGLTAALSAGQDRSVFALSDSASSTVANIETSAMSVGSALAHLLSNADGSNSNAVSALMNAVAANASAIASSIDSAAQKAEAKLRAANGAVSSQLNGVNAQSAQAITDIIQTVMDANALLSKQGSTVGGIGSGFAVDMGKLGPLISQQLSGVADQSKAVASDVLGGSSGEASRLNAIIASLVGQSGSSSSNMAARVAALLAAGQQAQAGALVATNGGVFDKMSLLSNLMSGLSKNGIQTAGDISNKASTMSGTLGNSLSDLQAVIDDTTGQAGASLSQLATGMTGKASDTFASLVDQLKGLNAEGSSAKTDFIAQILGPNSDAAGSSFSAMKTFLANLLNSSEELSDRQKAAIATLRSIQAANGQNVTNIAQTMQAVAGLTNQLGGSVGVTGQQLLVAAKAQLASLLRDSLSSLSSQTTDSLGTIDNLINRQNGPAASSTIGSVSSSIAGSLANIDSISHDFTQAEKDQLRSLSGLRATAISLLGQSSNQGATDKAATQAALASARANIVAKFREIAANSTDTQLGSAMNGLAIFGSNADIVNALLGSVATSQGKISNDAAVARDVNDRKAAQFQSYVDAQKAALSAQQAKITAQLNAAISDAQTQRQNKTLILNGTREEMEATLSEIREKVLAAQQTLGHNLQIYQAKLDGIIGEIRSYMNLSADADELAIRQDISNQLAKVNATSMAIGSANAAVAAKLAEQAAGQNAAGASSIGIVGGVIDGAVALASGAESANTYHDGSLIAIAANVDASTQSLSGQITASTKVMDAGITDSSAIAGATVQRSEARGAKVIDQLNQKASDVASVSRKAFIRNLRRMGQVDDDTTLVTHQLGSLLGKSDSTIADVSGSVISHLDLSTRTLAALNGAQARQVATVGDVMGAFSSVVGGFLNETDSSISTIMDQLNSVEKVSKLKLDQIDTKSRDELNWVDSKLDATSDAYHLFIDQERAVQTGIKSAMDQTQVKLAPRPDTQLSEVNDAIAVFQQTLGKNQASILSKVRAWINSRDPKIAKNLLSENLHVGQ